MLEKVGLDTVEEALDESQGVGVSGDGTERFFEMHHPRDRRKQEERCSWRQFEVVQAVLGPLRRQSLQERLSNPFAPFADDGGEFGKVTRESHELHQQRRAGGIARIRPYSPQRLLGIRGLRQISDQAVSGLA